MLSDHQHAIFVTYAWDNQEHQDKVFHFVNFLRDPKGYDARMDKLVSQQETAISFQKMMHRAMTDYNKVIIVLSPKYKQRAHAFEGGVGTEYSMIINDIDTYPNKYILVSFSGRGDDVVPLSFASRDIIDLSNFGNEREWNRLIAKLNDTDLFDFVKVAEVRAEAIKQTPVLAPKSPEVVIKKLTYHITVGAVWRPI
ncbi:hypothetical protein GO730_05715 [Spirosoma sp. HMF3257]|uniref:SEFIR domain-containing protein n=1 Tax=Spirosoma telluris TaxID=2183553 RepID=A0A327NJ73_9BACT|nr:hypothetical protein [Spirosoma telluris]RAI73974.1 hypothetical protein HMF3257_05680 [Spirosoma telluris]